MNSPKRFVNNYFDGLPLAAPQIMIFLILMVAYFFQQYSNWGFNFLVMAILKSGDFTGRAGNIAMAQITSWYFIGMTLGGVLSGFVSDLVGRRKAMLAGILILSAASVVTGLTSSLVVFRFARAATGFGVFFLMVASHAYIAEMSPAASRGKWQCWIASVGFMAAPTSALLSRLTLPLSPDAWRYVLVFGGLGIVPFFLGLVYLKESPRWLVSKGRRKEAEELMEELTGYLVELPPENGEKSSDTVRPRRTSFRPYRKRTIMLLAVFVTLTPATFFHAFWTTQLLSNVLAAEVTAQIMQYVSCGVPLGCLLAAFTVERGGRKISLAFLALLGGITSLAMGMANGASAFLIIGFLSQIFNMSSSFILFCYTVEQYPTRFRNVAAGILNGCGRMAVSAFQPLILLIMAGYGPRFVLVAVAALYFASLPLLLLLGRRTSGMPLEQISLGDPAHSERQAEVS